MQPAILLEGARALRKAPEPRVRHAFVPDTSPDPPVRVCGQLWLSSEHGAATWTGQRPAFTHVLNVFSRDNVVGSARHVRFVHMLDLPDFDLRPALREAHAFLDRALLTAPDPHRAVLVHCHLGESRSVAVVVSYLMLRRARGNCAPDLDGCLRTVRRVRPRANPNPGFMTQLIDFEKELLATYSLTGSSMVVAPAVARNSLARGVPTDVALRRFASKLWFAYVLCRPGLVWTTSLAILARWIYYYARRSRGATTGVSRHPPPPLIVTAAASAAVAFMLRGLATDDVFLANASGSVRQARAGLYSAASSTRLREILGRCPTIQTCATLDWGYWGLLGGDATSVSFVLAGYDPERNTRNPRLQWIRQIVDNRYSVDWAFPSFPTDHEGGDREGISPSQNVCLLLAGIGGNSQSPYVRCVATRLLAQGWAVCVLMARGLGICSVPQAKLNDLFNPCDDGDIHSLVVRLSDRFANVAVCGFSLGGIATCRYFAHPPGNLPRNVRAGVAFSGGFSVDFISNPRYESVYQELLVPGLVDDIIHRYAEEIRERVGPEGYERVVRARTYRDLHRDLYCACGIPNVDPDYESWKGKMGGDPGRVNKPLLVVTALDDPLHHPLQLNLGFFFGMEHEPVPSNNVAALVTRGGGHVAWPLGPDWHRTGFEFMGSIACEFVASAVHSTSSDGYY